MPQLRFPAHDKFHYKVLGILIICLSLIFIGGSLAQTSSSDTPGDVAISEVIPLNRDVSLFVSGVYAVPNEKGLDTVSIIFKLKNEGTTTFDFYPYWLRIEANGVSMPVELVDADQTRVMARSERYFIFYTELPHDSAQNIGSTDEVTLRLIQWDVTAVNFEKTVATVHIDGKNVSRLSQAQTIRLPWPDGSLYASIESLFQQISEQKDGDEKIVQYMLHLMNYGRTPQSYPSLQYGLVTADGIFYPLNMEGEEPKHLLPKVKTSLTLSAHLPASTELQTARIYLLFKPDAKGIAAGGVPLTSLQAVPKTEETPGDQGGIYTPGEKIIFQEGPDRKIELGLTVLPKRIPYDDRDLFTAVLEINNTGHESVELPDWEGFLGTEDGQIFSVEAARVEAQNKLYPGQSATYVLNGILPYDLIFNQAELKLTPLRPAQGNLAAMWQSVRYRVYADLLTVPVLGEDEQPILSMYDRHLKLSVIERRNYPGLYDDVVSTVLEIENDTLRSLTLPKLYGSYVLPDGRIYKALAFDGVQTVEPLGKAVVELYTILFDSKQKGIDLLVAPYLSAQKGEKDNDVAGIGEPIGLRVPDQASYDKPEKGIEVNLYPLHLWLSGEKKDGVISYRLEVNKNVSFSHDAHELTIVFFDSNGLTLQSTALDITQNAGEIAIPQSADYYHVYDRVLGHQRLVLMNKF